MIVRQWIVVGGAAALALAAVATVVFIAGSSGSTSVQPQDKPLTVAATIFPLADIVRAVGGDTVDVILIIPPGVSEHSSALTPQHLQGLQKARAIFLIGHELDNRIVDRIVQTVPAVHAITVDEGIELREFGALEEHDEAKHDPGTVDPHYWLTVPNGMLIAHTVATALTELDPLHAVEYQENVQTYQRHLESLEADLQTMARAAPRTEFVAMHDAWSYFAEHYGWQLVATYEPVEGRQPSLADLQHIADVVTQHDITTFYAEPQKATSAVTRLFADEFDLRILALDPVGGVDESDSYAALMRRNVEALVAGAQ